ncbi:hypothetical protein [Absidia glauca]|uniref:Uncharacterized protein n=1 Tax=Absidia glauca TaxID=4829 RepID=A0A163V2J2_ABSGL|nr:hypothetical protein [Absidia glauca]
MAPHHERLALSTMTFNDERNGLSPCHRLVHLCLALTNVTFCIVAPISLVDSTEWQRTSVPWHQDMMDMHSN